jgi:hypothetical protein
VAGEKERCIPTARPLSLLLVKQRDEQQHPTLGIIRPESIIRLRISPDDADWTQAQTDMLRQQHFFAEAPEEELQKIPFIFRYEFHCAEDTCRGHTLMCTDWEMGQSYRKWKSDYGDRWEEKFRQRYEFEMMHKNDTHFYVGTVASHPHRWIIIGLFYPPREAPGAQDSLF